MVLLAKSNILPRSLRCFWKPVIPFDSAGSTPQQPSISFRQELENTHFFLACWSWGCDMMEDETSITNKYIQICTFDFVSPKNMEMRSCWAPFDCFQSVPFSHFFPSDLHARFLRRSSWPFPRPRGLRSGSCSGCSMESRLLDTGFESTFIRYPRTHRDQRASQLLRALMLFGFGTSSFWPIPITSGKETGCYWQRDFSLDTTWFRRCLSIIWTFMNMPVFLFPVVEIDFPP